MPELKHTFSKGRMNKDLDERLVPNGEYRDALNIEVSTSEGSNVGAVQTLKGTTSLTSGKSTGDVDNGSTTVGSIVDEKTDKIYWLVAGPSAGITTTPDTESHTIWRDLILEYDSTTTNAKYVFVDIWKVKITAIQNAVSSSATFTLTKTTGIRRGMILIGTTAYGGTSVKPTVSDVNHTTGVVTIDGTVSISLNSNIIFREPPTNPNDFGYPAGRALNFSSDRLITGINILDDFLMWTDNFSEPKKINITRSLYGTGTNADVLADGDSKDFQTRLVVRTSGGNYKIIIATGTIPIYMEEQYITVIKKSPLTRPVLVMSKNAAGRGNIECFDTDNKMYDGSGNILTSGDSITLTLHASPAPLDIRHGDILVGSTDQNLAWNFVDYGFRAVITNIVVNATTFTVTATILSVDGGLPNSDEYWYIKVEQSRPLFEFKFPRFSYRYKYEDGEYSAFGPWSGIAFLPEEYDYLPKKGYNLGMTNNLRSLKIRDFVVEPSIRPRDVVAIDILYKEDGSPNVYTVKTVKKDTDEWEADGGDGINKGEIEIESEMIHAVVPSNQMIRPWDSVPRAALGQEVVGNRLVYGNYLHNYDIKGFPTWGEDITPVINTTLVPSTIATLLEPEKSIKSLRTYQIGIAYRDIYGRETPVLTNAKINDQGSVNSADIKIDKKDAITSNKIQVNLDHHAPYWSDSFKFFIKETSNEYYNLSMDRWYNAQDGNVWLVFNSADRNKVDENTYLIMKKQHDSDGYVQDEARYKIIAIENEAPEFVKLNREVLGVLTNTTVNGVANGVFGDTAGTAGYPLENINEVHVDGATWNDSTLTEAKAKNSKIRFKTTGDSSLWYKIAAIKQPAGSSAGDLAKIKIDGKFGADMNFTSTGNSWATRIAGVMLEIRSETSENRPEFDGKFFVKILGDQVFKENVQVNAGVSLASTKVIESQMKIRWIDTGKLDDSDSDHDDPDGDAVSYKDEPIYPDVAGAAGATATGNAVSPVRPQIDQPDKTLTYNTTVDPTNFSGLMTTTNWQIDLGSGYSLNATPGSAFEGGTIQGTNPERYGGFGHHKNEILNNIFGGGGGHTAAEFWRDFARVGEGGTAQSSDDNNLFIDMAYFRRQRDDKGDKQGGGDDTEDMSGMGIRSNYGFPTQIINGASTIYPGDYVGSIAPNPSNEDLIDISFANIHPAGYNPPGNQWDNWNPFSTIQYPITGTFIDKLTSPGCIFRFKEDPDQIEYTVTGMVKMDYIQNYKILGTSPWANNWADPENKRVKWTLSVSPKFGQGPSAYHPTKTRSHPEVDTTQSGVNADGYGPPGDYDWKTDTGTRKGSRMQGHGNTAGHTIEILQTFFDEEEEPKASSKPALWETEPKEDVGLDIYYEVGQTYPRNFDYRTNEQLIPVGSILSLHSGTAGSLPAGTTVAQCNDDTIETSGNVTISDNAEILFTYPTEYTGDKPGGIIMTVKGAVSADTTVVLERDVHQHGKFVLPWFNCYTFGNGVESNRIRDDFNALTIDKGVRVSTTTTEPYKEERRGSGMIYSGIYNSMNGVNNLNQFVLAEGIQKDLNPVYGKIQKLHTRNTDIVALCEDKIFKILANKDALYNADGNINLTATNRVLGATQPVAGDYGISTNPESFVAQGYRAYFTDKNRAVVIRMSMDGITPISNVGMKDYFIDNLKTATTSLIGTFDDKKTEYNLTLQGSGMTSTTVSYNESTDGWTSFKSFIPESGESFNSEYYTFKEGRLYKHHDSSSRNNFYGTQYDSYVKVLFNDQPGSVKSFQTLNYEGSQAKITENLTDGEYFNLSTKTGWYVSEVNTDLQTGKIGEFKNKENKWFNYLRGETTSLSNLDSMEFSVQGIGNASTVGDVVGRPEGKTPYVLTVEENND